jgi:membrane-associated phospholipid phosphatase
VSVNIERMNKLFTFVLSLILFQQGYSQNLDTRILNALNSPYSQTSDRALKFLSNTTKAVVVSVPVSIGIIGLIRKDTDMVWNAVGLCATAVVSYGLTQTMKYAINRTRPYDKYPFIFNKLVEDNPSFPSGHTSSSFALATSLSLEYPKWYIIAPSYIWASSVAYSRLQLGMHYPSDVIAGALVGAGCAYICYKGNLWLKKKYKKNVPIY